MSYLAEARQNAVSNYQFSTATEWFAEAYAAFYDPKATTASALNDATRNWFLKNLGAPPTGGAAAADGDLAPQGILGRLARLDDVVDPEDLGSAAVRKLPADLKIKLTGPRS